MADELFLLSSKTATDVPLLQVPPRATAPTQLISMPEWRQQISLQDEICLAGDVRSENVLTAFEGNKGYHAVDQQGGKVMVAREKADFLHRQCLDSSCRGRNVLVSQVAGQATGAPFLELKKKFSPSLLCWAPPTVEVIDVENSPTTVGTIETSCHLCDFPMTVKNSQGEEVFTTRLDGRCQPGLFLPLPFPLCDTVRMRVDRPGNDHGEVTKFQKRVPSSCSGYFAAASDNYELRFKDQSPEEKALLVATALTLDMIHFT